MYKDDLDKLKKQVRRKLFLERKKIDKTFILEKSKEIQIKLFSLPEYIKTDTIMFYISYDNEVYTHAMIQDSIKQGKNIVVPKVNGGILIPSILTSWSELTIGSYNILEPKQIKPVMLEDINIVIVPGIGFDIYGHRIGHGRGYYDRFLREIKSIKIGLAFDFQILQEIPYEEHDIEMDKIITEKRIIECDKNGQNNER